MPKSSRLYSREIYKEKQDWLKSRGFGGSSASAILGKNPYMSKVELYRAIVMPNKNPILDKPNEAMYYGTQCEPLVRKMFTLDFADKYDVIAPKGYEMYRRKDKPYLTATLDGRLTEKSTGRKGVLEIKTHDIRNKADEENWNGHIPDNYYIQVMHYLVVMNDYDFVVLTAKLRYFDYFDEEGKKLLRTEIRYYYIERSEVAKEVEYLEKKETDFWENNITKKVIPSFEIKF